MNAVTDVKVLKLQQFIMVQISTDGQVRTEIKEIKPQATAV